MPYGGGDNARERHRQHEFPSEIHHLIDARARERAADPDVNEKQRAKLYEKPDVGWNNFKYARGRVPAAQKQGRRKPTDCEHSDVFSYEKRGVFESGILGHVSGDDLRFAFRDVEWC